MRSSTSHKAIAGRLAMLLLALMGALLLSSMPIWAQGATARVFLPAVMRSPAQMIFGFETSPGSVVSSPVAARASGLAVRWVRLNGALWNQVEPTRGAGYNWAALAQLDAAIAQARALGMTPVVVVRGTPTWASVTGSGCAAIQAAYVGDFANFMEALVRRYKDQVNYWEIWNEPDVDSSLVPSNSPYGCWGNIDDPYYGGEHYGRVLQTIAPRMRAANPYVKIVHGGLLLDRPLTTNAALGRPELFLEGVLRSGAAGSFDILPYHAYPYYTSNPTYDYDLDPQGDRWYTWGGWTLGKAAFLRQIMDRYGVSKPMWLNETALICLEEYPGCSPAGADFFTAQANFLVRAMTRAASGDIEQVIWYTLSGPGWANGGLLDASQSPRPAYTAYQRMAAMVGDYSRVAAVDYGAGIEAYRFTKPRGLVDVLWSRSGGDVVAQVPAGSFRSAVIWDGATPPIGASGQNKLVHVGFQAVFIERTP